MATLALVTGAGGLVGRQVLRHWHGEAPPAVPVDHRDHDLLVPGTATELVRTWRPDVVVHLAWTASGTPGYRTSQDNDRWVDASIELARACTATGARLFATGTGLDRSTPTDAYSAAKAALRERLAPGVASGEVTWLRPYYVVDPDVRRPELLAHVLRARDAEDPVVLRTPDSAHDFIHASDVGSAIALAVRTSLTGEVDIGSGRLRTVRSLVEALGVPWQAAGTPPDLGAHHHEAADTAVLRRRGWFPQTTEELFHRD